MDSKKQNAKGDHVVIVTSQAPGATVKKFKVKRWMGTCAVILICILLGAFLGYVYYEERIWAAANGKMDAYKDIIAQKDVQIAEAQADVEAAVAQQDKIKKDYENQLSELNDKLTLMSDTVNAKVEEVNALTAQVEAYSTPTLLPLTGAATIENSQEMDPACVFYASDGALVVATASGKVTELVEDTEYGYRLVIDHGNGYMTIYYNQGDPTIKAGDEVRQGATLFIIEAVNSKLIYRVVKDEVFIEPMDIMQISG